MEKQTRVRGKQGQGRFLRRFEIRNVKTFRSQQSIDFCLDSGRIAQWTVILGENGTGKTSLLQYIAGMLPVQELNLPVLSKGKLKGRPPFRPTIGGHDLIWWHANNLPRPWTAPTSLEVSLELSQPSEKISSAKKQTKPTCLSLKIDFNQSKEQRAQVKISYTTPNDLSFFREFQLSGYGASRHVAGPASPYLSSDSIFRSGITPPAYTLYNDDQPLISPEQWLLALDHTSKSSNKAEAKKAAGTLASAISCLISILPEVSRISVEPYGLMANDRPMAVVCQTPFGRVPFSSLSLGYQTMAAWLTDFMKRMHDRFHNHKFPNHGPAIALIDEFDLHMHPSWQRDAMAALSREFPNTQFVVTAHSPLIVQALDENINLVVLRKTANKLNQNEVIIDSDPLFAHGWRIDQILASDLYNLSPRSETYQKLLEERIALRKKPSLTPSEKRRLKRIEDQLDSEAPPGLSGSSVQLLNQLKAAFASNVSSK